MSSIEERARVLIEQYRKLVEEHQLYSRRMMRYREKHDEYPPGAEAMYKSFLQSFTIILEGMRRLRDEATSRAQGDDPFAGLHIPDYMPEELT